MSDWDNLRDECKTVINMRRKAGCSIDDIARAIPAGRTTVYDIINGKIGRPRPSLERCIERFVKRASVIERAPTPAPE